MATLQYSVDLTSKNNRRMLVDGPTTGVTYIGISQRPESLAGEAHWMIVRETVSGALTTVEWAGGGGYDNVWTDRATLTYSKADQSQP